MPEEKEKTASRDKFLHTLALELHHLTQPLSIMQGALELALLSRATSVEQYQELAREVLEQVGRMAESIRFASHALSTTRLGRIGGRAERDGRSRDCRAAASVGRRASHGHVLSFPRTVYDAIFALPLAANPFSSPGTDAQLFSARQRGSRQVARRREEGEVDYSASLAAAGRTGHAKNRRRSGSYSGAD